MFFLLYFAETISGMLFSYEFTVKFRYRPCLSVRREVEHVEATSVLPESVKIYLLDPVVEHFCSLKVNMNKMCVTNYALGPVLEHPFVVSELGTSERYIEPCFATSFAGVLFVTKHSITYHYNSITHFPLILDHPELCM